MKTREQLSRRALQIVDSGDMGVAADMLHDFQREIAKKCERLVRKCHGTFTLDLYSHGWNGALDQAELNIRRALAKTEGPRKHLLSCDEHRQHEAPGCCDYERWRLADVRAGRKT